MKILFRNTTKKAARRGEKAPEEQDWGMGREGGSEDSKI